VAVAVAVAERVQGVVGRVQVAVQALVVQEVAGWRPAAEQGPLASMLRCRHHHRSQSR